VKQANKFQDDMLDWDSPQAHADRLWFASGCADVCETEGGAKVSVVYRARTRDLRTVDESFASRTVTLLVRAYGSSILRLTTAFGGGMPDDASNPMLLLSRGTEAEELRAKRTAGGWRIFDTHNRARMIINTLEPSIKHWSDLAAPPPPLFRASVLPDGEIEIPFMAEDTFSPDIVESVALGYVERGGSAHRSLFSLHAEAGECFAGTGERFAKMDLSGRTIALENADALGVNNRRAYKNVPLYVSSRPYGLLILTPSHVRLSLADISTRAAQGLVEDDVLDLFVIGGGTVERIVRAYRQLTGFPPELPAWTYGVWMSRMSYRDEKTVMEVAHKLRELKLPCDVINIDGGWCTRGMDWEFDPIRFPQPAQMLCTLRTMNYRASIWQAPWVGANTRHFETAIEKGLAGYNKEAVAAPGASEGKHGYKSFIDFSNPEAVAWYKSLLKPLLRMGISVIKTDFGEQIEMNGRYKNLPALKMHNLYGLIYPKAAFEITRDIHGEGIVWARPGWIGSQRYPVHWGGDSACTWDGLAGTVRGGLHMGLSGFAYWSHDVPGFHGLPNFMNSRPSSDLYVRWTQVGVFSSHIRYHGTSAREPYEYPDVCDIVRRWFNLRYCLIPYIIDEAAKAIKGGYPLMRAMIFHHQHDRLCWHTDDQYYFGDSLLVAPVLDKTCVRDVYLPEGAWVDFWSGETIEGAVMLKDVKVPLERIPVFARRDSAIRMYPHVVQSTSEMDMDKCVFLRFDGNYKGLGSSILGDVAQFDTGKNI
jgi:alpha-D-xyloside xylohydrolase